ncbi:MAG: hypothetical protein IRZ16_13400 [Myxococcaceae bacterium]|nr:hypothetical protein [Myxococcaceae bacterium]
MGSLATRAVLPLLMVAALTGCGRIAYDLGMDEDPVRATWCHWWGKCLPPGKAPPLPEPAPSTFRQCDAGEIQCVAVEGLPGSGYRACEPGADGTLEWSAPRIAAPDTFCHDDALVQLSASDFPCPPGEERRAEGSCAEQPPQDLRLDVRTVRIVGRVVVDGQAPVWTGRCDDKGPALVVTLVGEHTGAVVHAMAGCLDGFGFEARVPADRYTPTVDSAASGISSGVLLVPGLPWTGPEIDAIDGDRIVDLDVLDTSSSSAASGKSSAPTPANRPRLLPGDPAPVALRLEWNGAPFSTTARCVDDVFAIVRLEHESGLTRSVSIPCGISTAHAAALNLEGGHWHASMAMEPVTARHLHLGGAIDLGSFEVTGPGEIALGFDTARIRAEVLFDGRPPGTASDCSASPHDAGLLRLRAGEREATFVLPCTDGPLVVSGLVQPGTWDVHLLGSTVPPAKAWGGDVRIGPIEIR